MKIEINNPIIDTVFKDDVEENELFLIPRFEKEGKVFIKIKPHCVSENDELKYYNALCINDGTFMNLEYDEFVIPCKSEITLWKIFK